MNTEIEAGVEIDIFSQTSKKKREGSSLKAEKLKILH